MADIKISQLGAAIAVGDTDLVPIVSGGNTLKATAAQVKEHSIGNTNISSIGDGSVTGAINALNTDKQPKTLDTALTIDGTSQTTVEGALGELNTAVGKREVLVLSTGTTKVTALPYTFENADIDTDMVCIKADLGTPSSQLADWSVDTLIESGVHKCRISGTNALASAGTTITLYLMKSSLS